MYVMTLIENNTWTPIAMQEAFVDAAGLFNLVSVALEKADEALDEDMFAALCKRLLTVGRAWLNDDYCLTVKHFS